MKKKFMVYSLFCIVLTGLPLIPAKWIPSPAAAGLLAEQPEEVSGELQQTGITETRIYHVLDSETGEILEVPVRDYLIGAVGAEMPVSFEPEALKAQAVAAHTYAERQSALSAQRPELNGADFSDDPNQYQAFYTREELQTLYDTHFLEDYQKISDAVDAVLNEILVYQDEPIIAAFHAMSGGRTESAQNVWGSEIAYLQSVDSHFDENAPQFEQSVSFTPEEVRNLLESARTGLLLGTDTEHWFGEPVCSEAGTVQQIPVGTSIFTGQELRSLFSLRSAVFTVQYQDRNFIFTTKGCGHDVGMSQYGANAMALNGATYREILTYYYPGTALKFIS